MYFVYVKNLKGVTCEKLISLDENIDSQGKEKKPILQKHKLSLDEETYSLKMLEQFYKYEGEI